MLKTLSDANSFDWTSDVYDLVWNEVSLNNPDYANFELDKEDRLWWVEAVGIEPRLVIQAEDRDDVLMEIWYDKEQGLMGKDKLYAKVKQYFVGISKGYCEKWVARQEVHQIAVRPSKNVLVNPVVTSRPFLHWQLDLIDFSNSKNRRKAYIMHLKDTFSKYCYLRPLAHKGALDVKLEVEKIINTLPLHCTPHVIQTDRGNEFLGEFDDYLNDIGVKHVLSAAYKPTSQAIVERANYDVKQLLRRIYYMDGNRDWVDNLESIQNNLNGQVHSVTGFAPEVLHDSTLVPTDDLDWKKRPFIVDQVYEKLQNRSRKILKRRYLKMTSKDTLDQFRYFRKGDKLQVRLKLSTLKQKQMLKLLEEQVDFSKGKLAQFWTNELFQVEKIGSRIVSGVDIPVIYVTHEIPAFARILKDRKFFTNDVLLCPNDTVTL